MATGRRNQITKQIGEYLVAAELGRHGFVAVTFSGSLPLYDIIATDERLKSVPVQVKAITGSSWQFDVRQFADVSLHGRRQVVGRPARASRNLVCVMVALASYGADRFYILEWRRLRDLVVRHHRAYLDRHDGIRPQRFDSFHCAITETQLSKHRDTWSLVGDLCA